MDPVDDRVARVVRFYESLQPADLARLHEVYADDAAFKDPFNDVRGTAAIAAVFAHMFRTLQAPRFVVLRAMSGGDEAFLAWEMHARTQGGRGRPLLIRGASHLGFAADGRVAWHRDYWDAAEELYEQLPLLGPLMRWLKRQVMR